MKKIFNSVFLCFLKILFFFLSRRTIKDIQNCLEDNSHVFYFDMGTLLGIVRDKKLLKNDMDIDVAIIIDDTTRLGDIRRKMRNYGFKLKYSYYGQSIGLLQDTYYRYGIRVDVSYYRTKNDVNYCYLLYEDNGRYNKLVRLSNTIVKKTKKVLFNGVMINIPDDDILYLCERYGPNWDKPDPGYKYWEGPSAKKIDSVGKCVVRY